MGAWVIVLEWEIGDGIPLASDAAPIRVLLGQFGRYHPSALFAADRYALRLELEGDDPGDVLTRALALHHEAADRARLRGWRLARAELITPEQMEQEWTDGGLAAGLLGVSPEDYADPIAKADRLLDEAHCAHDVSEILCRMVRELGGGVVNARTEDAWTMPVDLSFGTGGPILPVAEPWSHARNQLEQVLPRMVERARRIAVERPDCGHDGAGRTHG